MFFCVKKILMKFLSNESIDDLSFFMTFDAFHIGLFYSILFSAFFCGFIYLIYLSEPFP